MLTANILVRVWDIIADKQGTATSIDYKGQQYLVTANHVLGDAEEIIITQNFNSQQITKQIKVQKVGEAKLGHDIAVLRLKESINDNFPVNLSSEGIILSQDIYAVGFPRFNDSQLIDNYPKTNAYVVKGCLSAMITISEEHQILVASGLNYRGFSGGPLVFYKDNHINNPHIAGILYESVQVNVADPDGENSANSFVNGGFMKAISIRHVLEIIDSQ